MDRIGTHCNVQSCHMLDFLPFSCEGCHETFCLDHRSFQAHSCRNTPDSRALECPLCHNVVPLGTSQNANQAVSKHIDEGCKNIEAERRRQNRCQMKGCRKFELMPIGCNHCRKQFCISHRQTETHQCEEFQRKQQALQRQTHIGPFLAKSVKVK